MEDKQKITEIKLSKKGKYFLKFFVRFLKEHHCFAPFQRELFRKNGLQSNEILYNFCECCDSRIIAFSFTWAKTKEGHKYWKRLNDEFYNLTYGTNI